MRVHTLTRRKTLTIVPKAPFHFDGTFHKPSHFPDQLEDWEPGVFWQTIRLRGHIFGVKIENQGTVAKPKLRVGIYSDRLVSSADADAIRHELSWLFGIDEDLGAFIHLAKKDRRFFPVFKKWLGMRSSSAHNLYGLIIVAVVLQNATVRRSVQMLKALLSRFGVRVRFDGKELYAFWQPAELENVTEQKLRDLRIGYRAKFIKRLSQDFALGKINEHKLRGSDKATTEDALKKLYGVGPETARILLFEAFRHYDTFEHIAPWQQKIYSRLFYGKSRVSVEKIRRDIQRRYGSYAMLAVHYIWEDIFWRRKHEHIEWLDREIRL
ncbi:MAG: hypothetical protein AAB619_03260 [Patescibacteria group bacterium]